MIFKSFTILLTAFSSLFYYFFMFFLDNGVTAEIKISDNIRPGETVVAEVIIKKGNVGGFAKLQIEAGQGLTIEEQDNKGATFGFSGNTAKWIWTALPMEAEFKVKFKVTANASASGTTSISGKFSYIVNNTKQIAEIPAKTINIGNATSVAATQETTTPIATTTTTETTSTNPDNTSTTNIAVNTSTNVNISVTTNTTTEQKDISPTTEVPAKTPTSESTTNVTLNRTIQNIAANNWLIKITINKGNLKGFARYSDVLPPGLSAKAEDKDGSSFFVDGNSIKFVWSNLPDKETLVISYRLTGSIPSAVTLNGEFSYTENNQVMSKTLPPESIQPPVAVNQNNNNNAPSVPVTENVAQTSVQSKQTTVFFSVQLGAFLKSSVGANYFTGKYNIPNVRMENHESYKKFYSGNFEEYKGARDYREEIKQKGISDAFVIAHKNNVRITVQEALMITNQKWYP
ncbi:MAG: hypothetical protein KatS3mg028_1275 [Bacteroidia bacterium]|nr:MAG: hypothetical protein KatS3mg028_1275 [Bacteroidia bacterium]